MHLGLGAAAARPLGQQRVFRAQLHAAGEAILVVAILGETHVAGGNAGHRAVAIEQHFGGGKARVDFNSQRFRLGRQPATDITERDHVIAVVVHQRRQHEVRQAHGARCRQPIEAVVAHFGLEWAILAAPIRHQLIEPDGIDHGARENVRADLGPLFDHDHGGIGRKLFEPDRRGEAGGPGADDHDVELHRLAGGRFLCAHRLLQSETAYASGRTVTTNRERSTPFTPAGQQALLRRPARAPIRGAAMTSTDREGAARALLAFYREAGVDALLEETPTDRFASDRPSAPPAPRVEATRAKGEASPARSVPTRERELPSRVAAAVAVSPEAAVMAAREAAKGAASLEELRALLERFEGCALRTTATQLVFADGNPQARVMFVGEAPGRDEDIEGLPFVGRSGKLLDRMMAAIGIDRTSAYIANIVPWRPPGNRTPTPQESVICLGNPSTQTLLNSKDGILKTRGRWFPFHTGTREIRAMATLHPAYLLRQPLQKRLAWRDFLAIKKALAT